MRIQISFPQETRQLGLCVSNSLGPVYTKADTVMRIITTFQSTTDRVYDGGPIKL